MKKNCAVVARRPVMTIIKSSVGEGVAHNQMAKGAVTTVTPTEYQTISGRSDMSRDRYFCRMVAALPQHMPQSARSATI